MRKTTLPVDALGSYPRAPRASASGWFRDCLSLAIIAACLEACTLGPQNLNRVARETPKETPAVSIRDVAVEHQRGEPGKSRPQAIGRGSASGAEEKKVGEAGEGQKLANFEIDLTNFKDRLATLSAAEIVKLMGPPEFERFEPPARIWQYRAPSCVVDFFLYDDGERLGVEYVNVRMRGAEHTNLDDRECLASTLKKPAQNAGKLDNSVDPSDRGAILSDIKIRQTGQASSGIP